MAIFQIVLVLPVKPQVKAMSKRSKIADTFIGLGSFAIVKELNWLVIPLSSSELESQDCLQDATGK
jgi:hypothetical protein